MWNTILGCFLLTGVLSREQLLLFPSSFPVQLQLSSSGSTITSRCHPNLDNRSGRGNQFPVQLLFVYPSKKPCFLCTKWATNLDGMNLDTLQQENVRLFSIAVENMPNNERFMTLTGAGNQTTRLPRPILLYVTSSSCGKVQRVIDLVALPNDIDIGTHLAASIQQVRQEATNSMAAIEIMCKQDVSNLLSPAGTSLLVWSLDSNLLLNNIMGTDIFDTPDVILIGLFDEAPSTTCGGWSALAFGNAAIKWNEMHDETSNVKFVGTYSAETAHQILQNISGEVSGRLGDENDDGTGTSSSSSIATTSMFAPGVVALKRGENTLLWMSSVDIDLVDSILNHVQLALDMRPRLEFSRYTPETSRQIWGHNTNVHVMVVVDEEYVNNTANVQQQLQVVETVASGLPNAHFSIVSRSQKNEGILSFFDLLEHPRKYLQQDGGDGVPANVVIINRVDGQTKKYRMFPDHIPLTTISLKRKELKSFMREYMSGHLQPHWKSEPRADQLQAVDVGLVAVGGLDLQQCIHDNDAKTDILLSFEASWCRTCQMYRDNLKEAAIAVQAKYPQRIRFLSVNLEKNEVDHALPGISLRQQPWQYTMPLIWIPHGDGEQAVSLPWRGARGALSINEEELTKFLLTREGYDR